MKYVALLFGLCLVVNFSFANNACVDKTLDVQAAKCSDTEDGAFFIYVVDDPIMAGQLVVSDANNTVLYTTQVRFDGQSTQYSYIPLPSGLDGQWLDITYSSADGCAKSRRQQVREQPHFFSTVTQPTCSDENDGSISVSGTSSNTSLQWSDGAAGSQRNNLAAGNYTLTVTSPSGCTITSNFEIIRPNPVTSIHKVSVVECNGVVDRMYKAYPTGGSMPYTYQWRVDGRDVGINEASIHYVDSDDVALLITDANGCQSVSEYVDSNSSFSGVSSNNVTIPPIEISGSGEDTYDLSMALDVQYGDADNDQADGSIYQVSYYNTMTNAVNGTNAMPSPIISSSATTYYLRADASSNCFDVAAVALQLSSYCLAVSEACDNDAPVELEPVECSNTLTPLPGGGTFEIYRIDGGIRTLDPDALVLIGGVPHIDPTDREGNYDIDYTYDDGGSLVTSTAFFDIQALNPRIDIESDTICGNIPSLQIRTNPIGGTLTGLAIIDQFVVGTNQFFLTSPSNLAVEQFHAFTYTYSQANASGLQCTKVVADSFFVQSFPAVDIFDNVTTQCEGSTVSQTATISNPTPTTTYAWRDGNGDLVGTALNLELPSITETTTYSLTATRENGCSDTDTVRININELPRLSCVGDAAVTCPSGSDGVASVDIMGVTDYSTYDFMWSTGSTDRTITNLRAGDYTVSVTTDRGCIDSCVVNVTEPVGFSINCTFDIRPPLCAGENNGSTVVVVSAGGTPPYNYSRDNVTFQSSNLVSGYSAGMHQVYVRDAEGCIDSCSFVVPVTPSLECSISAGSITPTNCNGTMDGSATVVATGGTGSYSYLWDNGETTATATQLSAGTRSVVVTDANGCTTSCNVIIIEPGEVTCSIVQVDDVLCAGENSGSATVQALGGTPGYTVSWSDGQSTATATGLAAATYAVTVSDVNGCSTSCTVTINEPSPLTANPQPTSVCEGDMVLVDADPDPRITSHSWSITGGSATGVTLENADQSIVKVNAMQATPGNITLSYTGQDASNCAVNASIVITVEDAPDAGDDVTVSICNTEINEYVVDLTSLLSNQATTGGAWTYTGTLAGPDLSDPTSVSFECFTAGEYTFSYFLSPQGTCASRSAQVSITVEDCFDLALIKTVDNRILTSLTEPITFDIAVHNQGPITAYNVEVTDYIEEYFNLDPAKNTAAATNNIASWELQGSTATIQLGDIPPFSSREIIIVLDVDPNVSGDELYNSAEITSYGHRTTSGVIKLFPPDEDDLATPPVTRVNEQDDDIRDDSNGSDDNPSDDDQFDFALLTLCGSTTPQISCNDEVNISLDGNCEGLVTPDMILEGDHPSRYVVELRDSLGNLLPNPLTADHVGMYIEATVLDDCSANSCWSRLIVEDKFAPEITCVDDITISCLAPDTPLNIPDAVDACEGRIPVVISSDEFDETVCSSGLRGIRTISYYAEDGKGNRSETCTFTISYDSIAMDDILIDESIVLECDDQLKWDGNGNYYPEPWEVQIPSINGIDLATYVELDEVVYENYCQVNITYDDVSNDICENSYSLTRKWSILNWCSGELVERTQVILVTDTKGPVVVGPQDNFMIVADANECTGDYVVEPPTIVSECGTTSYTVGYLLADETGQAPADGLYIDDNVVTLPDGRYVIRDLPTGQTWIRYTVHDGCGNRSFAFTEVLVVDEVQPVPVCDQFTTITLTSSGVAEVKALTFDDGSHDNCTDDLYFEARRLRSGCGSSTTFGEHVAFCCADVASDEVMVELRVWDDANGNGIYGDEITVIFDSNGSGTLGDVVNGDTDFSFRYADNSSTCMVSVKVDDKTDPTIVCPKDITLDCGDDFTDLALTGSATADDNCGTQTITHSDVVLINQCGSGTVTRTFKIEDLGGRSATCSQTITIIDTDPFDFEDPNDLTYPQDVTMEGCEAQGTDVSQTGEPTINGDACNLVAYTYSDRFFALADSACYKIYRTFTVIDWCQFDQSNPDVGVDRRVQTIYINNSTAPTLADCDDRSVCIFGENCDGAVTLSADASDDCTPSELLQYVFSIDYGDDGSIDRTSTLSEVTYTMDPGVHRVRWIVADRCGNTTECTYLLTVEDCKKPTPYCLSEVTTVVMPSSGMVSVTASDFDLGSTDNCDGPLTFSFDENGTQLTRVFECVDLGLNEVDIWVTDASGNSDFCTTWVHIQSNDGCDGSRLGKITGAITTESSLDLDDVEVTLTPVDGAEIKVDITSNGLFAFEDLAAGEYQITASDNKDHDRGVTTLDLVMIQRHILGLATLDSPYKILAADVNNTESVSGADVVELRKLILGINSEFESRESWVFYDQAQGMDPQSPWAASESAYVTLDTDSTEVRNFVGVKVGDVNNTALNGLDDTNLDSRSADAIKLGYYLEKKSLLTPTTITINSEEPLDLLGYQMTIEYDHTKSVLEAVEGLSHPLLAQHYREVKPGMILVALDLPNHIHTDAKADLFRLTFSGPGEPDIRISNSMLRSEAYDASLTPRSIQLEATDTTDEIALLQNTPNPFESVTRVQFELGQDAEAVLQIYDVNGRVLEMHRDFYKAGKHSVEINTGDLGNPTGILYYQLTSNGQSVTKKMMVLR